MPHFHIPLQSGSDTVLRLMHRRYDAALFAHKVELIKEKMPPRLHWCGRDGGLQG